ncbi:MAG: dipeptidase [Labilithrix sp.]|nr:dipeptidase [Labilithrix sp.]MCW5817547.1 dipeptidase [Labilithrix sp.]
MPGGFGAGGRAEQRRGHREHDAERHRLVLRPAPARGRRRRRQVHDAGRHVGVPDRRPERRRRHELPARGQGRHRVVRARRAGRGRQLPVPPGRDVHVHVHRRRRHELHHRLQHQAGGGELRLQGQLDQGAAGAERHDRDAAPAGDEQLLRHHQHDVRRRRRDVHDPEHQDVAPARVPVDDRRPGHVHDRRHRRRPVVHDPARDRPRGSVRPEQALRPPPEVDGPEQQLRRRRRARPLIVRTALSGALLAGFVAAAACGSPPASREVIGESTSPHLRSHATGADGGAPGGETLAQHAERLHRSAIVIDTHDDIPSVLYAGNVDLADKAEWINTDLSRMKAGGVTGLFFSVYVESDLATQPSVLGGGALRRAIDLVDVTYRAVERNPKDLVLATTAADVRRAKRDGKIAILMGIEGGHAIENSLSALRVLHRLGCRYMTLTHTQSNEWADSAGFSGPPPVRHHGLTPFGEDVVREMQRLGMLVDVSHTSDETFAAVMKIAEAPVIASHSSARALADHRRNLSDDMLKQLAKNGGVVMVNFWSLFLSKEYGAAAQAWYEKNGAAAKELRAKHKHDFAAYREAMAKLHAETEPLPKVPLSVLVDHIDHVVKVAGIDHVGLGSDFDGVDALPDGVSGVDAYPKITEELLRRGYKDDDVKKVLGENFLRVFERAEAFAKTKPSRISGDGNTRRIDR